MKFRMTFKKISEKLSVFMIIFAMLLSVFGNVNVCENYVLASDISGEKLTGVEVSYVTINRSTDWSEYSINIKNNTTNTINGMVIKIPANGDVHSFQCWGLTASYSDGYIYVKYTKELSAGASAAIDNTNEKFGFSGGATLGSNYEVFADDGSFSTAGKLNYEITGEKKEMSYSDTPVGKHGKLSLKTVDGYKTQVITDKNGNPFQLRGASSHGVQWDVGYNYINKGAYQSLRDEWGVNMVRLALYVTQGGYTQGAGDAMDARIVNAVEWAKQLGLYVLIDWHIHEENPHDTKSQAEKFFATYANKYKDYDNVLFEICNEPTGVNWYNGSGNDLYSYCKDICTIIRNQGSDALIVCGTNTWSQDVDEVSKKPLKDDGFENILYTLHFYSASHYDDIKNKFNTAINDGTPVFITEFGICDATGNGSYDTANADSWIEMCDATNTSFCCWQLSNKGESSSYLISSCNKTEGGWVASDLSTTGVWVINTYRAHQEAEEGTSTTAAPTVTQTPKISPVASISPTLEPSPVASISPTLEPSPVPGISPTLEPIPTASMDTTSGTGSASDTVPVLENIDPTATLEADDLEVVSEKILKYKKEKDFEGSTFSPLFVRVKNVSKTKQTISWSKVPGATGYMVFGNKCGRKKFVKLDEVDDKSRSFRHTKLKKGNYYKYMVIAYSTDEVTNKVIAISKIVHSATTGGKKGNPGKIKLKKKNVTLKKGKNYKIKAALVKAKKKTRISKHRKIAFETSNPAIARVSAKGKITAVSNGVCVVYVYAQNGLSRKVKVTVK